MKKSARLSQVLKSFQPSSKQKAKRSNIFGAENEYKVEIVTDFETRVKAYQLLYQTYLEKEFTQPHASKMWYSIFDLHPNTATFVVKENDHVCGALTIVIDSPMGLPADEIDLKEFKQYREKKSSIAEIISLGIDSSSRGGSVILEKLFNYSYLYARGLFGVSEFIITVNPRHALFYEKKLLFKRIGSIQEYGRVSKMPADLLALDLSLIDSIVESNIPPIQFQRTIYKSFVSIRESSKLIKSFKASICEMSKEDIIHFLYANDLFCKRYY